ncbi:amidohydrolase family protein [Humidisolicoccus flavus]|uniref:amidohydrolase n=1 Tax=Humidisolicoccus flavus TaxID=3111414 RepID=UPI00325159C5
MIITNALVGGALLDIAVDTASGTIARMTPAGAESHRDTVVDAAGSVVIPGLWDAHVHMEQTARALGSVDISHAESKAQALAVIAAALGLLDRGAPLVVMGMRDGIWSEAPLQADLDALSAAPLIVQSFDLHCLWVNSAALQWLQSENIDVSLAVEGVLREAPAFAATAVLDRLSSQAQRDTDANNAMAHALSRGVVGIVDLEMGGAISTWLRRANSADLPLRIDAGVYPHELAEAEAQRYSTGQSLAKRLRVGPAKILTDGSLGTRTAFCHEPYGVPAGTGTLEVSADELDAYFARVAAIGLQPAVHAIGDAAVGLALDAFERAGIGGRLEHAQLVADEDVQRFAGLGVVASVQPRHALDDIGLCATHWPDRQHRAYAFRSLLDAGATLLFGSDAPVAPLDPWQTIAAAVHRAHVDEDPWFPEQQLTLEEAFAASTQSTIAPGQVADLVILADDPWTANAGLAALDVAATIVDGEVMYQA